MPESFTKRVHSLIVKSNLPVMFRRLPSVKLHHGMDFDVEIHPRATVTILISHQGWSEVHECHFYSSRKIRVPNKMTPVQFEEKFRAASKQIHDEIMAEAILYA